MLASTPRYARNARRHLRALDFPLLALEDTIAWIVRRRGTARL